MDIRSVSSLQPSENCFRFLQLNPTITTLLASCLTLMSYTETNPTDPTEMASISEGKGFEQTSSTAHLDSSCVTNFLYSTYALMCIQNIVPERGWSWHSFLHLLVFLSTLTSTLRHCPQWRTHIRGRESHLYPSHGLLCLFHPYGFVRRLGRHNLRWTQVLIKKKAEENEKKRICILDLKIVSKADWYTCVV